MDSANGLSFSLFLSFLFIASLQTGCLNDRGLGFDSGADVSGTSFSDSLPGSGDENCPLGMFPCDSPDFESPEEVSDDIGDANEAEIVDSDEFEWNCPSGTRDVVGWLVYQDGSGYILRRSRIESAGPPPGLVGISGRNAHEAQYNGLEVQVAPDGTPVSYTLYSGGTPKGVEMNARSLFRVRTDYPEFLATDHLRAINKGEGHLATVEGYRDFLNCIEYNKSLPSGTILPGWSLLLVD